MSNTFLRSAKYQVTQFLARVQSHTPLNVSIEHLEEAKTVRQLSKAMKRIQASLWELTSDERLMASQRVTDVLNQHVLKASDACLKLVAADWLRFLLQAGIIVQPEAVFVTLVTAAIQAFQRPTHESARELRTYLKLIFESFWPFRSPYDTYPRELFPSKAVFYPLMPLFSQADTGMQESLLNIFTQLPTLDNVGFYECLLHLAGIESSHAGSASQRRVP